MACITLNVQPTYGNASIVLKNIQLVSCFCLSSLPCYLFSKLGAFRETPGTLKYKCFMFKHTSYTFCYHCKFLTYAFINPDFFLFLFIRNTPLQIYTMSDRFSYTPKKVWRALVYRLIIILEYSIIV